MKSIGIITIHKSQNNYGGALQCFALYSYIASLGHDVEIIDLHRPSHKDYVSNFRYPMMRQKVTVRSKVKGFIKELLNIRSSYNPYFEIYWAEEAVGRFDDFNNQIKYSQAYTYIPDLYKTPPVYDIYISGSDQLWNPTQWYCLEPYFLTFVKDRKGVKASYGTSIGLDDISTGEKYKFAQWLKDFDIISVRESQAQKILSPIVKQTVEQVPDPTFLLDREIWIDMAVSPNEEEYILVFSLGKENTILEKAVEIAMLWNCKVKVIDQLFPDTPINSVIEIVRDAGPCEFIGLIRNAILVLNDSFHCTVFALITNTRNFYTYISPKADRGSRIVDLLNIYGLQDHIVNYMNQLPDSETMKSNSIDYRIINGMMDEQQAIGRGFIDRIISISK